MEKLLMKKNFLIIKILTCLIIFVFAFMPLASAATLFGKIFDYNLRLASNSIIKINTFPEQQVVAVNGAYSFTVPEGEYIITAYLKDNQGLITHYLEHPISVAGSGSYVHDIILFPRYMFGDLELEDEIEKEFDEYEFNNNNQQDNVLIQRPLNIPLIVLFLAFICVALIISFVKIRKGVVNRKSGNDSDKGNDLDNQGIKKSLKKENLIPLVQETDNELNKMLCFIKKEKRTTQKELRKMFPFSEAKISLMISDLESQGKIRKIKRGRGNIIISL